MIVREKWFWHIPFPKVDGLALLPYLTHNTSLQASVVCGGQPEKWKETNTFPSPNCYPEKYLVITKMRRSKHHPFFSPFFFSF